MDANQSLDTFLADEATASISEEPRVNFEKFRDTFMIISELEHFRTMSYQGPSFGDRESQLAMVTHIRSTTEFDGDGESISPESWSAMSMDRAATKVKQFVLSSVRKKSID